MRNFKTIELALYYVLTFWILRVWLLPVMELAGIGYENLILLFIVLCLLTSLLRLPFFVSWIVKIGYIGWFIVYVYSNYFFLSNEGMRFLLNEVLYNAALLFRGDYLYITDSFQSILLFILIWMLVYIVHFWLTVRMNLFAFLALTVVFVGLLDTFTVYDGALAIVQVVLSGMFMMFILFLKRLMLQSGVSFNWHKYLKLVLPVVLVIGIVGFTAVLLPKAAPQWPDPVPYIKSLAGQGLGGKVKKVGYDEDDSVLGGSFDKDDTVVFIAHAPKKQYWRIETKDVYTSKGWETSLDRAEIPINPGATIHHSLPVGPDDKRQAAYIEPKDSYNFIVQPYGLINVNMGENENEVRMKMNLQTEKISANLAGIDVYQVVFSTPEYLYSDLTSTIERPIDPAIREKYLQLPNTLPQRVIDLAKEIVEGKLSDYDKALAIESYFKLNGFRYETEGVPVPKENQDYVDQFLFETKIGYCDNFSTAMVVMLRAVGIPARWVKGFAGGEEIGSDGELKTYQITNNDAHSWVEAYIPKVGWVPFEPTIGFSTNRAIQYDLETDAYQDEMVTVEEEAKTEDSSPEHEETANPDNGRFAGLMNVFRYLLYSVLIGIIATAILLLIFRKKWLPKWYHRWMKRQQINETTFETIYMRLLKMLELNGLKRKKGQTLEAFAKEVDETFAFSYMSQITAIYEQYIYGKKSQIDHEKVKECWENLINRISG